MCTCHSNDKPDLFSDIYFYNIHSKVSMNNKLNKIILLNIELWYQDDTSLN